MTDLYPERNLPTAAGKCMCGSVCVYITKFRFVFPEIGFSYTFTELTCSDISYVH